MRILIDSSNYFADNRNHGDAAIFELLAKNLFALWPDARIQFITQNADAIRDVHRGLEPLVIGRAHQSDPAERLFEAVEGADLVLATGGGYYSDAFPRHAEGILDTLQGGMRLGKPAVIFGAGFEPVTDSRLLAKARAVLPEISLIACREPLTAPPYIESLGVDRNRVVVTGDAAVEMAYEARSETLGDGIGVNVRQAPYAAVDDTPVAALRDALRAASDRFGAPLRPLPISHARDNRAIAKLIPSDAAERGLLLDDPDKVLREVTRCRIVVSGSYHAIVFALSQGIPCVGLENSLHYRTKLAGVAAQFAAACAIVSLDGTELECRLCDAMDTAWRQAGEARPLLLERARLQVEAAREAYRRIRRLVSGSVV